jgi:hypothetical protein
MCACFVFFLFFVELFMLNWMSTKPQKTCWPPQNPVGHLWTLTPIVTVWSNPIAQSQSLDQLFAIGCFMICERQILESFLCFFTKPCSSIHVGQILRSCHVFAIFEFFWATFGNTSNIGQDGSGREFAKVDSAPKYGMHGLWVFTPTCIFLQRVWSVFDVPIVQIWN